MPGKLLVTTKKCDPHAIHDEIRQLGVSAYGLVMTPQVCGLCAWRDGCFEGNTELGEAYEIRAFCSNWEMRWVRDGSEGVATLIGEDDLPCEWDRPTEIPLAGVLERRYLLWGSVNVDERKANWTILSNGRTAPISVPIPVAASTTRIQLVAHEYLARFGHGNVCVFDQRLVKLVEVDKGAAQAPKDDNE